LDDLQANLHIYQQISLPHLMTREL
jgi:hypothetical protein